MNQQEQLTRALLDLKSEEVRSTPKLSGETVGLAMAEATNAAIGLGKAALNYLKVVGRTYAENVRKKNVLQAEAEAIAEQISRTGNYEGKLPNGLQVKIVDGELVESK